MPGKIHEILQRLNRENTEGKDLERSEPVSPEDFIRMKEWIRQAQADADRARLPEDADADDLEDS